MYNGFDEVSEIFSESGLIGTYFAESSWATASFAMPKKTRNITMTWIHFIRNSRCRLSRVKIWYSSQKSSVSVKFLTRGRIRHSGMTSGSRNFPSMHFRSILRRNNSGPCIRTAAMSQAHQTPRSCLF